LFRNRVELCQFRKEKCELSFNHLLHVSALINFVFLLWIMNIVTCFVLPCSSLKKNTRFCRIPGTRLCRTVEPYWCGRKNPQRRAQIEQLRDHVCQILNSEINEDEIVPALQDICALVDEYKRSIPAFILQYRTVSPRIIAKLDMLSLFLGFRAFIILVFLSSHTLH
jgi:hypothetical protein